MRYNAKEEYMTLLSLKELGLANEEELKEFLEKNSFSVPSNISLILERWKARDIITVQYCDDNTKRYKIAKIPAPFQSVKMENVKKMRTKDMLEAIKQIESEFPEKTVISETVGKIRNYKNIYVEFITVDPILGGVPDKDNSFKLHRNSKNIPIITQAHFKGWFRENGRLINLNPNSKNWIAYSEGTPLNDVIETCQIKAPVVVNGRGAGIACYEAFKPDTKFKALFRIPFEGIGVNKIEDIEKMFKLCEIAPKRGLGSNPFYCGGKIKLLEIKEVE